MYIITRKNPTAKTSGLSQPMFWTGDNWSWMPKEAKHYQEKEAWNTVVGLLPLPFSSFEVEVELHQFFLEHYKSWEGNDWYKVIRFGSKTEVGCLGFSQSKIFGDGWSIQIYIGNPGYYKHEKCGFSTLDEAIKAAEDFLGGEINSPSIGQERYGANGRLAQSDTSRKRSPQVP